MYGHHDHETLRMRAAHPSQQIHRFGKFDRPQKIGESGGNFRLLVPFEGGGVKNMGVT